MAISTADYFMGRDRLFGSDMTPAIQANAVILIGRVNRLLEAFGEARHVTSGWRPPAVNQNTPNAALKSKHMTGQAVDLADPDGDLDEWCMDNLGAKLAEFDLYQEHPAATKGWCHLQCVPPKSGKRIFYP